MSALQALRTSTAAKRLGTPLYQAFARCVIGRPGPRILANSAPKAGTHVLSTLLSAMPGVMFSGRHSTLNQFRSDGQHALSADAEFRWDKVRSTYGKVRPGQFATGHFPAHPEFQALLSDLGMRTIVIFRDPRDMVVSTAYYIRSLKRHPWNGTFAAFPSVEEAITAAITGLGPKPDGTPFPSMADRLAAYGPWLDCPDALIVRFEDLVGENGGGSRAAQVQAVSAIAGHIDRPLDDDALERVCGAVFSEKSATFRKGQIGDWKNHLSRAQVDLFKDTANEHLLRLGYESSPDW